MILINRRRLLDRFLRYVKVDTAAVPDSPSYPSSAGQTELGRLLLAELQAMGATDAHQDENGLVWATIPATVTGPAPTILLNAHVDTSPEASGRNVQPQIIENYGGGDIPLLHGGRMISEADCPALTGLIGHTLVVTDGTTLLGGDDKAGVAVIMELAEHFLEHPQLPHGPVRILFTCDEEIGKGTAKVDLHQVGAVAGYTLDGSGAGEIEAENFSADGLTVKAIGRNIHPSIGKGRMVNSIRALSRLISALPQDSLSPETTEAREGFIHPYMLSGSVAEAECRMLLRDFETAKLDKYEAIVRSAADQIERETPGLKIEVTRTRQYRNMADALARHPLVVELADRAFQLLDRPYKHGSIRGGTDGAMLSEMGLPTPNLSVGQHNIHSELEFVSLDEMGAALEHLVVLLDLWQQFGRA
ncbi:MAG: peptidase T [Pirellulales bacterium]